MNDLETLLAGMSNDEVQALFSDSSPPSPPAEPGDTLAAPSTDGASPAPADEATPPDPLQAAEQASTEAALVQTEYRSMVADFGLDPQEAELWGTQAKRYHDRPETDAQFSESYKRGEDTLKVIWGADFEANRDAVRGLIASLPPRLQRVVRHVFEAGLGNVPSLGIRLLQVAQAKQQRPTSLRFRP